MKGVLFSQLPPLQVLQLLQIVVIGLISVIVIAIVQRLVFHPLRRYPGPFLSRISGLPTLYHAWKGDLHYHLYRLHHKYGSHVRYSPNKLSVNSAEALNAFYGFNKNDAKPEEFYSAFRVNKLAINTFNTSSKEDHRRKRRIMAKGFSESALSTYQDAISEPVDDLIKKLNGGGDASSGDWSSFNWAHEANCLMLDIMGRLCFGEAFGFVQGKGDDILPDFHRRAVRIYMTAHEPLLKRLHIDRIIFPQMIKANTVLRQYVAKHTLQRVGKHRSDQSHDNSADRYQDIFTHLLDARDDETGSTYSDNELLGEATLLLMAGSDTTATALTATLFYLAQNPKSLGKLRKELQERFSSADDIRVLETEGCKYLRACLDEAMRLCPPSPTNIPRVVGPGGLSIKDGQDIFPEGIYVGVPNFAVFRNAKYFEDPHQYVPERWMGKQESSEPEKKAPSQMAFQPFSLGPRHCIGQRLALKEMSYIIAKLVYLFDFRIVGELGRVKPGVLPDIGRSAVMEQIDVFTSLERGPVMEWRLRVTSSS